MWPQVVRALQICGLELGLKILRYANFPWIYIDFLIFSNLIQHCYHDKNCAIRGLAVVHNSQK